MNMMLNSYSTYKELKHAIRRRRDNSCSSGCRSQVLELKHAIRRRRDTGICYSYSTYKELKHQISYTFPYIGFTFVFYL